MRNTVNGEGLYIINIRRANDGCWLQTNEGWLIFDPLVISDTYYGGDKEATVAGQPPCLKAEMATTTGSMNIRQSPSTSSPVVSSARAGDTFIIIQQTVSGKYCWLQVSQGWLAVTERVKAFRPNRFVESGASAPPATAPSDIDNCCFVDRQCTTEQEWTDGYWAHQNGQCGAQPQFSGANLSRPRIEGSEAFVTVVNETLNLMERKTPALYQYVVSVTSVVEEHGPDRCDWGLAYVGTGRTSLGSCLKDGQMPEPLYVVAAYLAHEACHHHGDDMINGEFDHEPCYKAGHDAYAALSA
ncbi:MAG: SH3 domain-containing protein [Chloroflexi bacterium]|nr:SH3 domain-containing protein [Chloroflexota bacterium]